MSYKSYEDKETSHRKIFRRYYTTLFAGSSLIFSELIQIPAADYAFVNTGRLRDIICEYLQWCNAIVSGSYQRLRILSRIILGNDCLAE